MKYTVTTTMRKKADTRSAKPSSHRLGDVANFFLGRLSQEERQQLQKVVAACEKTKRPLKVGTLCSGTDAPVPVLKHLRKALGGKLVIEHVFSCEFDGKKQEWIQRNFPQLPYLFADVNEVGSGKAKNLITGEMVRVPGVDIVIAGFVCKSVSTENNERQQYANCINEAIGQTGETFNGVAAYVQKYKPSLVICENVKGLTMSNKGKEPVVHHVMDTFKGAGYSAHYDVLDSRNFVLPHRRQRCWMWAFKGRGLQQVAEQQIPAMLQELQTEKGLSMDQVLRAVKCKRKAHKLNERQRKVVKKAKSKVKGGWKGKDVFVDIAKSEGRAPHCTDAASCIVPNSMPYRIAENRVLEPKEVMALQGIWEEDFPALSYFAEERKGGGRLVRDLAGNAFTSTVCMAVLIAALTHMKL